MYITQNHCCEVTVGGRRGADHFVVHRQLLVFFLKGDSFCTHSTEFIPCSCNLSFLTIHPLSALPRGGVWECIHRCVDIFQFEKKMCETFEFVCVRVSFAVAAVNGKRQPSLATKSVSHALALQPLPWQPRLCTRRFLPLCFYTERLLASKRLQQGPSLSLPF